jgi:hypothetical protein
MATPDLTDEETEALVRLLRKTIDEDRYPLSPRIRLSPASRLNPTATVARLMRRRLRVGAPTEPRKSAVAQTKPYAMWPSGCHAPYYESQLGAGGIAKRHWRRCRLSYPIGGAHSAITASVSHDQAGGSRMTKLAATEFAADR